MGGLLGMAGLDLIIWQAFQFQNDGMASMHPGMHGRA